MNTLSCLKCFPLPSMSVDHLFDETNHIPNVVLLYFFNKFLKLIGQAHFRSGQADFFLYLSERQVDPKVNVEPCMNSLRNQIFHLVFRNRLILLNLAYFHRKSVSPIWAKHSKMVAQTAKWLSL